MAGWMAGRQMREMLIYRYTEGGTVGSFVYIGGRSYGKKKEVVRNKGNEQRVV